MKKTLILALGLSLTASAYAKSPAITPTIASFAPSTLTLPIAPVSPIASIALLGLWPTTESRNQVNLMDNYEYILAYDTADGYINGEGEYEVTITLDFILYDLSNGTYTQAYTPSTFYLDNAIFGSLTWGESWNTLTFQGEVPGPPAPTSSAITTNPTSIGSYPIAQTAYMISDLP